MPGGLTVSAPDQRLQERGRLLAEGHSVDAFESAVSSLRTSHSSGYERLRHEPAEQLDRSSLRADDAVADDPRDDLVVAHAPQLRLLVELHERLRQLVQLLVVPPLHVKVRQGQARVATRLVEGLAEPREDPAELRPAGRVEAGAVSEHLADLLVLPRRHVLEHLELRDEEADAQDRAAQKTKGAP